MTSNKKAYARKRYLRLLRQKIKNPAKRKLGGGGRFQLIAERAKKYGAKNPEAVAAAIMWKKYGKKGGARLISKGRKK